MFNSIQEHIKWIFSGVGVSLGKYILKIFVHKESKKDKEEKLEEGAFANPSKEKNNISDTAIETETIKIAKRFNIILDLMNEGREYNKFSIAKLAEILKLEKVSDLENIFLGKVEPTFQFIDIFCETFGVNKEWLIEGKGYPFQNHRPTKPQPLWYLEDIKNLSPKNIFFIRAKTEIGETFILLKIEDWKYIIFHRIWHISDHVGAGGQGQILSFYNLIKELKKDNDMYIKCGGRMLESHIFFKLYNGKVFPGSIIDKTNENYWWDDFIDINHDYPISENYEQWYGKSFIKAQQIVKNMLERQQKTN